MLILLLLEHLIPAALVGVVLDDDDVELALPLGMRGEDLVRSVFPTNGPGHGVAGLDEGIDYVRSDKRVGTSEESAGHVCWLDGFGPRDSRGRY